MFLGAGRRCRQVDGLLGFMIIVIVFLVVVLIVRPFELWSRRQRKGPLLYRYCIAPMRCRSSGAPFASMQVDPELKHLQEICNG
jgi:hypothetical protein